MLGRTLKMTFWVMYDHLGKLVLANLVWAAAVTLPGSFAYAALAPLLAGFARQSVSPESVAPAVWVGLPLAVITLGIVLPVVSVGLAEMARELIDTRDGSLKTMFSGMRRYGLRAVGLGLAYLFLGTAMATSVWFYPTHLTGSAKWLGILLGAVAGWALLFLLLTALLSLPALVQKKGGAWTTAKLAALLVFDNTFFVLALGIALVVWTFALAVPPMLFFFYGAVAVVMVCSAYELLARKYAAVALDPKTAQARGHMTRLSVEADASRILTDAEDDYLNRGVRDALFPWKG
jgi:uncharacterized membrane protein YesL